MATQIEMLNEKSATVNVDGKQFIVTAEEWEGTPRPFRDIEIKRIAEYKKRFFDDGE